MSTGSDDGIEQSRRRVALGLGDALDEWRLRVTERHEQIIRKDMSGAIDSYFVHSDDTLQDDVVRNIYVDVAEGIDRLGTNLSNQIRALEREVSELRGELKALRGERSKLWRPGDAT